MSPLPKCLPSLFENFIAPSLGQRSGMQVPNGRFFSLYPLLPQSRTLRNVLIFYLGADPGQVSWS